MSRRRSIGIRVGIGLLLAGLAAAPTARGQFPPQPQPPTVGVPARLDQVLLPGTELEAIPLRDRDTPLVLRIAASYAHGDAFRYDLVYYGLEPGQFDLRDYLRRKDGTPTADLPPIPVSVASILPPGQVEPNRLTPSATPALGGYRNLMGLVFATWCAGLVAILSYRRRSADAAEQAARAPATLAERLRPLVERAVAGTLAEGEAAELERLLIGYWRRRLGVEDASPALAIATIRAHEQGGPMLRQLEEWLHRPGGPAAPVDLARLLEPYQDLPADALEAPEKEAVS